MLKIDGSDPAKVLQLPLDTSPQAVAELLDYIRDQIDKVYAERRPMIERMHAYHAEAHAMGRVQDEKRYRNEGSRLLYEADRATDAMKRQWLAIAEMAEHDRLHGIVASVGSRHAQP